MLLGVVNSYDYKTRTATIVTVDQHPVTIPDVPVWSIFTGSTIFNIPLEKGTVGLVMFVDVDTTDFFHNGNIAVKFVDAFRTELNNAIFIPGWNSFVQVYDVEEKGVLLKRGECSIVIKDDNLKLNSKSSSLDIKDKEIVLDVNGNSKLNILDGGKFEIKNNTAELIAEIHTMLDAIYGYLKTPGIWEYVNTAGVVTPCTVNVANVALLVADLEPILAKIESFKN